MENIVSTQKNPALQNRRVFGEHSLICGIPTPHFVGAGAMTLMTFVNFSLLAAVLVGAVLFLPLYLVHREDPQGLTVLLSTLVDPLRFSAGQPEPLKIRLVRERTERFEFNDL